MAASEKFNTDRHGDDNLPALISCGGIILQAYDLDEILHNAANEETVLINETDPFAFAPHVQRFAVAAKPGLSIDNKPGIAFTGLIRVDPVSEKRSNIMFENTAESGI